MANLRPLRIRREVVLQGALTAKGDQRALLVLGEFEQEVKKDHGAALAHYLKGAEAGDEPCMYRAARLLVDHGETPQDQAPSREWLRKAADAGDLSAATDLGTDLLQGEAPDFATARRYLTAAAIEKMPKAQYQLGLIYLEGKGCPADPVAAVAWLTEAMKAGDAEVQFKLATLHEQGIGTPVNYANAGVLYTLACGKGHAEAAARIARMASEGLGTARNVPQGWAYASFAVDLGDERAKALVAELDANLRDEDRETAQKALAELRATNRKLK